MKKARKEILGFTLIEVSVSIAFVALFLTSIGTLLVMANHYRHEAAGLNTAMFLASQKMEEIKNLEKDISDTGEYPDHPEMSFEYTVETKDFDILSFFGEDTGDETDNSRLSAMHQAMKEQMGDDQYESGWEFPLRYYTVIIHYGDGKSYRLDYLRSENAKR